MSFELFEKSEQSFDSSIEYHTITSMKCIFKILISSVYSFKIFRWDVESLYFF